MSGSSAENKQLVGRYLQALSGQAKPPSLVERFVADATLAEHIAQGEAGGHVVARRGTFQGIHSGPFAGIEATGRLVSANLMIFYRIEEGRIAQHWMPFDVRGMNA